MNEKCFCHFNGYQVKDAIARQELEDTNTNLSNLKSKQERDTRTLETEIENLKVQVGGMSYSIDVVSSVDEMLDTNKVYINTTDGSWYYYQNGWINGGKFLPNISTLDVDYKNLLSHVKAMLTDVYSLDLYMENEENNIRLLSKRYLTNGKLVNDTEYNLVIRYKTYNHKLDVLEESQDVLLASGNYMRFDPNMLFEVSIYKTDNSIFTIDELAHISGNLKFISNSVEPYIKDNSISMDMLSVAVQKLIKHDTSLDIVRKDDTTLILNDVYGGTFKNNSSMTLVINATSPNYQEIDTITLESGRTVILNDDTYTFEFTKEDNSTFTDEELAEVQNGFVLVNNESSTFELTDGCISYNHLDQDLKNRLNRNDYEFDFKRNDLQTVQIINTKDITIGYTEEGTPITTKLYLEPCKIVNNFGTMWITVFRHNLDGSEVTEENGQPYISELSEVGKTYILPEGYLYQFVLIRDGILVSDYSSFTDEDIVLLKENMRFLNLDSTDTLEPRVASLETSIGTLTENVDTNTTNISSLGERVTTLEESGGSSSECNIGTIDLDCGFNISIQTSTYFYDKKKVTGIFKVNYNDGTIGILISNSNKYNTYQTLLYAYDGRFKVYYRILIHTSTTPTSFTIRSNLFTSNSVTTDTSSSNIESYISPVNSKAIVSYIGSLTNLTTTEKGTIVGAINELVTNMTTTETNLTLDSDFTTNTGATTYINKIRKNNKNVTIDCHFDNVTLANGWNTIGTIPEGYRPSYLTKDLRFMCICNGYTGILCGKITTDGILAVFQDATASDTDRVAKAEANTNITIHLSYIID